MLPYFIVITINSVVSSANNISFHYSNIFSYYKPNYIIYYDTHKLHVASTS